MPFDIAYLKQQEPNPNAALIKLVVAAESQGKKTVAAVGRALAPFDKRGKKKGDLWNF